MLWPIPVDTHPAEFDTMFNATETAARTFIGSLQTATNVSATNVFRAPGQRFSVCPSAAARRRPQSSGLAIAACSLRCHTVDNSPTRHHDTVVLERRLDRDSLHPSRHPPPSPDRAP